jgi:hypothetical protein
LHREFFAKQRITESLAISGLCCSVEACAPLIPGPVVGAIQELLGRDPSLCCAETMRFLQISFGIWFRHSPAGMSFACGDSFADFLVGSTDFHVGNSIAIVSSILKCKKRVSVVPVHCDVPESGPELIIFSNWNFEGFRRAFETMQPKMKLFETILIDKQGLALFAPFLLEYFPAYNAILQPAHCIPMLPMAIPDLVLETDKIFERAIGQGVMLREEGFEEYRLKKSINEAREHMMELEKLAFEYVQHDTLAFQLLLLKDGEFSVITDPTNQVMAIVLRMQDVIGMDSFTRT